MSKYPITFKQRSKEVNLNHPGGYDTNNPYMACRDNLIAIAKRIVFNGEPVTIISSNGEERNINNTKEFIAWIENYYEEGEEYGFSKDVKEELASYFK